MITKIENINADQVISRLQSIRSMVGTYDSRTECNGQMLCAPTFRAFRVNDHAILLDAYTYTSPTSALYLLGLTNIGVAADNATVISRNEWRATTNVP